MFEPDLMVMVIEILLGMPHCLGMRVGSSKDVNFYAYLADMQVLNDQTA